MHSLTTATSVRSLDGGGYQVDIVRANGKLRRGKKTYTAEQVVFAAAALGTQKLLPSSRTMARFGRCRRG